MLGEILERLTGNYRGDRPTLEQLANGTAYQQPKPQPQAPMLSLESLAQGTRNVATGIGDFLTGDDKRRDSERLAYEIGGLQREQERQGEDRKLRNTLLLNQQRALGNTSQARPFEIPTFDEQNNPITKLVDAQGKEIARFPREVKQQEERRPIMGEVTRGNKKYKAIWNEQKSEWTLARGDEGTPLDTRTLQRLAQSEVDDITQIETAAATMGKIEDAFGKMSGNKQGPIVGLLTGKNPYDAQIRELEKLIDMVTPSLARGVFREVGVLTDQDVARYRAMLPQAKTDPGVAKSILDQLKQKIQETYTTALTNYGKAGRDITQFDPNRQLFSPQGGIVVPKNKVKVVR
jgi:hypothetical protein